MKINCQTARVTTSLSFLRKQKSIMAESGRSMVEMLGVLAIIGVLSVGGIAGYSYAMTKHKANELINALNLRATVISQQRLTKSTDSLSEFNDEPVYPISVTAFAPNPTDYFGLQVTRMPKQVCMNIMTNPPQAISGAYQKNARIHSPNDCLENTTITFVYANDLKQHDDFNTNEDYDCTEKCPTGSVNPTCASGEIQKDTGTTSCSRICSVCLSDECPSGTSKECSIGTPVPATPTDYGTPCYTCNTESGAS